MRVSNCRENLRDDLRCIFFRHERTIVDVIVNLSKQISSVTQFSDDEESFCVLEDLLEPKNVGMVESLETEDHGHELVNSNLVHLVFPKNADSTLVFGTDVLAHTNLSVSAFTNTHSDSIVVLKFIFAFQHPICLFTLHCIEHSLKALLGLKFLLLTLTQGIDLCWLNDISVQRICFACASAHIILAYR